MIPVQVVFSYLFMRDKLIREKNYMYTKECELELHEQQYLYLMKHLFMHCSAEV